MVPTTRGFLLSLVVVAALTATEAAAQQEATSAASRHAESESAGAAVSERSNLSRAEAMFVLDYQVIPVPQQPSIDLMGFHVLNWLTNGLYVGVGAHAPLVRGAYGGFMAFDVAAHAQRRISSNLFADAGLSVGGGGGGRSQEHSKVLSGTGGFVKGYVGLGYDFKDFSIGANVARMKFKQSAIDHSQLDVFIQVPFSYAIGSYASSGAKLTAADAGEVAGHSSENTLTWGLDNLVQIDPQGSSKSTSAWPICSSHTI